MSLTFNVEVEQVVKNIFATVLRSEAWCTDDRSPIEGEMLGVTIMISGDWNGGLVINCSREFAADVAAAMLMMPLEEVTLEDERDAVAELVNMIGGNFKSVLPGQSLLSLPTISKGERLATWVQDAEPVEAYRFQSNLGSFDATIVKLKSY